MKSYFDAFSILCLGLAGVIFAVTSLAVAWKFLEFLFP